MIDTDPDVRRKLRVAAARLEVGPPPASALAERGRRRARGRLVAATGSVVGLLVAAGLLGRFVTLETTREELAGPPVLSQEDERLQRGELEPEVPLRGRDGRPVPAPADAVSGGTASAFSSDGSRLLAPILEAHSSYSLTGAAPAEGEAPLRTGSRIVKEASIELEVDGGSFGDRYAEAQRVVSSHDGFVHRAETEGEESRTGSLVIRVPEEEFEETLADLKALGVVTHEEVSGVEVTSEFINLRARLRNWLAQERAVRSFLDRAQSLGEILGLHRQLQDIEVEVEQLKGSLRLLKDQSSLGTIVLELREEGVSAAGAPAEEPSPLSTAWRRAIEGATEVAAVVVVGLGYLLPILLLLAAGWLGFRVVRPRARA